MTGPKEPKEFKYPRIYLLENYTDGWDRLRIIYPDGRAHWVSFHGGEFKACYAHGSYTGLDTVKRMRAYDERNFSYDTIKVTFIGEVK